MNHHQLAQLLAACLAEGVIDARQMDRISELADRIDREQDEQLSAGTLRLDPARTLESFVSWAGNSFARQLCQAITTDESRRETYSPLTIHGHFGRGKTHLLHGIANAAAARGEKVMLLPILALEDAFERADSRHRRAELGDRIVDVGLLLLDDFHLCQGREHFQRDLLSVVDRRIRRGGVIVLASQTALPHLEGMLEQLRSRLLAGVSVKLQPYDEATSRMILHQTVPTTLPAEVEAYLIEHVAGDMRRLCSSARQLVSIADDGPITLELARAILPLPEDLASPLPAHTRPPPATPATQKADLFKEMLSGAEDEEEQALALQIAIGERLRQLRSQSASRKTIARLEQALDLLQEGDVKEAIKLID